MNEELLKTTPKKVYSRKPRAEGTCRLCSKLTDNSFLLKVQSVSGERKNLSRKILTICGINIHDGDGLPGTICRKCNAFLEKILNFQQTCQKSQIELRQKFSIKRMSTGSPETSTQPPAKSMVTTIESKKQLNFDTTQSSFTNLNTNQNVNIHTSAYHKHYDEIVTTSITLMQENKILSALNTKQPLAIAGVINDHCPNILLGIKRNIFKDMETSIKKVCVRKGSPSVLKNTGYEGLTQFDFKLLWKEISETHPFIVDMLQTITGKYSKELTDQVIIKYCFIYGILMNIRWHELSLVQRLNTVLLIEGGCSKKLQHRFNSLGICLSYNKRDILLKLIGGHFSDTIVERIKQGSTFRGTGDNWDLKILKGQMRKDSQNTDLHLFASNLIENRTWFKHLPNDTAKVEISKLDRSKFSMNIAEWKIYLESAKVLVGRIWIEFLPKFQIFKKILPVHIPHKFSKEMAEKSKIFSMPIINANESSYADCVVILRCYENWIASIYHKAGLLDEIPDTDEPPLPLVMPQPGQGKAYVSMQTDNDPMKEMKIMFAGDQLTRVRFAGAKDLLAGAHTPSDRFEHCSPFKPVMWHTKASLLQYSYHLLYNAESVNQIGTLKYFREKYSRKNATPSRVLDSFDGSEELFLNVGRAYIVTAALKFFGMESMNDKPHEYEFPKNLVHASDEEKQKYFDNVLGKFLDEFLIQKALYVPSEDDFVRNYGLCSIFLAVLVLQLKDTAKEGDGERNLVNQKMLLSIFKSLGAYSKYAIEMFTSIAQMESLLTPRLAEEFKWGFFVNWRGGPGNNMEDDLAQEISNKLGKTIVQRMGANKTIPSISKVCKATNGIKEIIENFDAASDIHETSVQHGKKDSIAEEKEMIADLLKLDPFNHTPGRIHSSFPDIKRTPLKYLNIQEFHSWLEKHKQELT